MRGRPLAIILIVALILSFSGGCARKTRAVPQRPQPPAKNEPTPAPSTQPEKGVTLKDGVYGGSGRGMDSIEIEVTVSGGVITGIEVVKSAETESIGGVAYEELIRQALGAQNAKIDGVSGATKTSLGFASALQDALNQAAE